MKRKTHFKKLKKLIKKSPFWVSKAEKAQFEA